MSFLTKTTTLAILIALMSYISPVEAATGTYYGGGSSGTYYGSGSSGTYYGGGSSGTYYGGGQSGTYTSPTRTTSPSSSYYSYTPVSTYSSRPTYSYTPSTYSAPSYSAPVYSYTPQPTYSYVPVGGGSSAPQYQYVSSSNTNTNTVTNTFNPVNNNDAKINLIVYGGSSGTSNANTNSYSNYPYSSYTQGTQYTNTYQYAPAPIYTQYNSQSYSPSNVTLLRDNTTNLGTPVSGVFLSQVPATGIGFGLKMTLFTLGLVLWSIFAAFMIARRNKVQSAVSFHTASSVDKATAFKLANYSKKVQG